jgi:NAD(P)-dependent dehydrogenase (short-subunit alcohol dehydrogenase family)
MTSDHPVALVTGASRGAGRGIAIALGSHGCTVYVTGRSEKTGDANLPGTIHETAQAVTDAGGLGIAARRSSARNWAHNTEYAIGTAGNPHPIGIRTKSCRASSIH